MDQIALLMHGFDTALSFYNVALMVGGVLLGILVGSVAITPERCFDSCRCPPDQVANLGSFPAETHVLSVLQIECGFCKCLVVVDEVVECLPGRLLIAPANRRRQPTVQACNAQQIVGLLVVKKPKAAG